MDRSNSSDDASPVLSRRRFVQFGTAALGATVAARAAADKAQFVNRAWPADRAVPPLALVDLDGKTWQLSAWKGRPVLLNFWATWCEPCRAEMPSLDRLAKAHADAGLAVFTVNYQESEAKIREFLQALPIGLPVLLDRDGAAARAWTPRVFPSTVLIDRKGQPVSTVIGEFDWASDAAAALLGPLLAAKA